MAFTLKKVHHDAIRDGKTDRTALTRYGASVIAVGLACLVRVTLSPQLGREFPLFIFVFPVVFSAVFGGRGPGLSATALSVVIVDFAFLEPRFSFVLAHSEDTARMVLFAALGVVISLIVDRLKRANEDLRRFAHALEQANIRLQSSEDELVKANEQLHRSQDNLTQANARLKQSNGDLQRFAYSVTHDLQTPIRTIGAFCQLLTRKYQGKLDTDADELLAHIDGGLGRMNALIHDLLEYSKVTHVDADSITETDCNEILRGVLKDCEASVREASAIVTADPLPTVQADPKRLSQVFMNLIENGLKYRSAQLPKVYISARPEDGRWVFSVKDNGIGFDMAYAERIFTAFERLHSGDSTYKGSGIGLAIVKRIIERHGGTIWAESQPGAGSTFYFTIPFEARRSQLR